MKYIIIDADAGLPAAILFNEVLNHAVVAAGKKVISAGFCSANGAVWGRSESLGVDSRQEDFTHVLLALRFTAQEQPTAHRPQPRAAGRPL